MNSKRTIANHSFERLAASGDFLNIVLNNINSCILLLDQHVKLQAFNDALKTIFSNKENEDLLYMRCGEAIGCAYQIEEAKDCGKTTKCDTCELRLAALDTYLNNSVTYKKHVNRPFMNNKQEKEYKDLQFSSRLFSFEKEKYIILIIEDITEVIKYRKLKKQLA